MSEQLRCRTPTSKGGGRSSPIHGDGAGLTPSFGNLSPLHLLDKENHAYRTPVLSASAEGPSSGHWEEGDDTFRDFESPSKKCTLLLARMAVSLLTIQGSGGSDKLMLGTSGSEQTGVQSSLPTSAMLVRESDYSGALGNATVVIYPGGRSHLGSVCGWPRRSTSWLFYARKCRQLTPVDS